VQTTNKAITLGIATLFILSITGCIPSGGRCFPGAAERGYYCYKEYNFGQNLSSDYKKGIRDGCSTGEGRFRRDYSLSGISPDYKAGWDIGRAHCKLIIPEEAKPGMRTQYQQNIDQKKKS
jgi:hypothetical protein